MENTKERREHLRKLLAVEARIAEVETSNWTTMRLFDVSKAGIGFIHPQPLELNKLYSIEFRLPDSDVTIACIAIALHCAELKDKAMFRIGARFVWITEDDAERISDYVWQLNHKGHKIEWT